MYTFLSPEVLLFLEPSTRLQFHLFLKVCLQFLPMSRLSQQVFGCLYIIMSRRKTCDYRAVFQYLKRLFPRMSIAQFMADFEPAIRRALRAEWPDVPRKGCWAHYSRVCYLN